MAEGVSEIRVPYWGPDYRESYYLGEISETLILGSGFFWPYRKAGFHVFRFLLGVG